MVAAHDTNESVGEPETPPLDRGPVRGRKDAERTCIVTRETKSPDAMIRFVLSPDRGVVPDLRARLPGRGAWVTATRVSIESAIKRRQFNRAFRTERAEVPAGLVDQISAALREDVRQSLALANKAGAVVAGFAKVESAIGGTPGIAALLHASDASADGCRKLAGALRRRHGATTSDIPILEDLSNAELDMALGRDHVIHAALVAGPGSAGCLARWRRLRAFDGVATVPADPVAACRDASANDLHDEILPERAATSRSADRWNDESP